MLEITALQLQRGHQILNYELALPSGNILAIQGRSGVGKSSLLQAITGFITPIAGVIQWRGETLNHLAIEQRPVSVLFQDHNLFEHLSVLENLKLGFSGPAPTTELQQACVDLGVAEQLEKMPAQLSGGQRQRVALIRTLLRPEPIILLDEPFAELDTHTRQVATQWTRHTAKSLGKTLLMVTHQDEDVAQVADHSLQL